MDSHRRGPKRRSRSAGLWRGSGPVHGGQHRRAQNVALAQPHPFSVFIDEMNERQLPLAVQRFGHHAGLRLHHTQTVAQEVGAVGGINTDQWESPRQNTKQALRFRKTCLCSKFVTRRSIPCLCSKYKRCSSK